MQKLQSSGSMGVTRALGWLCIVPLLAGCVSISRTTRTEVRLSETQVHMGTEFRIVVEGDDLVQARTAIDAAFDVVGELDHALSDYVGDSELNRLNATAGSGREVEVSDDLWAVLSRGQVIASAAEGTFDPTVGGAVRLWRRAHRQERRPRPERLDAALAGVGPEHLILATERRTAKLPHAATRLDLGGIAKGYAVDRAFEVLIEHGLTRVLVDGGGDLRVGEASREGPWVVGLPDTQPRVIDAVSVAVASSGDRHRYVEIGGVRYSHIVDPTTGLGLVDAPTVTVIAANCNDADAWASALSVLAATDPSLQRATAAVQAWGESSGDLRARFVWTDGRERTIGRAFPAIRAAELPDDS